ncbi:MAG: single-stranded DNA-binding protein [Alphaproteobacteria bacterium]|jgi:single-strand DNA-binding protein|nr:single-stranded DNA-binding protein [Alphaproteobacteria bacterium]
MANPTITIVGRVGQDPVKLNGGGVRLRIVSNDRVKNDATNQWDDKDTSWWTVKAWKSLAEQSISTLKKGQEVVIVGKIYEETWQDKEGNNRTSYDVNADTIAVTTWSLSKDKPKTFSPIKDWHMDDVEVPF